MKNSAATLLLLLSSAALTACQSVPDSIQEEEPKCNNTSAQCLISWDRYLDMTETAYNTCKSRSGRCQELANMLKDGRAKMVTLMSIPNDEELPRLRR